MATAAQGRTPGQLFALVFGVVYLAVGLLGFAVTGVDDFFSTKFDEVLIVFPLNPSRLPVLLRSGGGWPSGVAGDRGWLKRRHAQPGPGCFRPRSVALHRR